MSVRDEAGFTLTELLVAMSLMIIVLSATLTTLDVFATTNQRNATLNDMRETTRMGVDRLAQELRNAGSRSGLASPVERAEPDDLVFDDIDPSGAGSGATSMRRLRYCLAATGRLWKQEQAYTAGLPPATACPDASFGSQTLVAEGIVNQSVGGSPPVFSYNADDLAQVTTIGTELFVDTDIAKDPATTNLSTSVRMRNRNRPPVAEFTATPQGNRHVLLNAGASSDPEGQQLSYKWECDGVPCPSWTEGQVVDYQTATTGSHTFALTVTDPGDLADTSATYTVIVP